MQKRTKLVFWLVPIIFLTNFIFSQDYVQDTAAVRAILDSNGLSTIKVASVTDSANGRVTALKLGMKGITKLPSAIGTLTGLLKLSLEVNSLTALPSEIGSLTKLEELLLYTNVLTSLPTAIGSLTKLKVLWVTGNSLTTLPTETGNLTALTRLILSRNSLFNLPGSVNSLKPTEQCDFGYNNLDSNALSTEVKAWLDQYDPDWNNSQTVPVIYSSHHPVKSTHDIVYQNIGNSLIEYSLASPGFARLEVLDLKGRTVLTLVDAYKSAGIHLINWDNRNHSSGMYYLRLTAENRFFVKKAELVK